MCTADPSRKSSHFFNSFLFVKMFESGNYKYASVKRWAAKVAGKNLFRLKYIVIPAHVDNFHWCLCVAFVQERRIQYYDSMGGPGLRFMRGLQAWLKDEARESKLVRKDASVAHLLDVENWTLTTTTEDTPLQDNGYDCGVFTCMFAKYISADLLLTFSCRDMPRFREEITWDLLRGSTDTPVANFTHAASAESGTRRTEAGPGKSTKGGKGAGAKRVKTREGEEN